jgi:hypothetical protein
MHSRGTSIRYTDTVLCVWLEKGENSADGSARQKKCQRGRTRVCQQEAEADKEKCGATPHSGSGADGMIEFKLDCKCLTNMIVYSRKVLSAKLASIASTFLLTQPNTLQL